MLIGFMGAHRTGKTTLAKAMAEKCDLPFAETNLSAALASMGVDPGADMPFSERLAVQETILDVLQARYETALAQADGDLVVVDRTPLDVLAYTRSEILRETMTPELDKALDRHIERAHMMTNFAFEALVLVQPGIALVSDPSKAPANRHYQEHVHAMMLHAVASEPNDVLTFMLPRNCLDIQSRVSETSRAFDAILSSHKSAADSALAYH